MPTRTRSVHAVSSARRVIASPVALGGSTWPPCQTDSIGSRSAAASQSALGLGERGGAEDDAIVRQPAPPALDSAVGDRLM